MLLAALLSLDQNHTIMQPIHAAVIGSITEKGRNDHLLNIASRMAVQCVDSVKLTDIIHHFFLLID